MSGPFLLRFVDLFVKERSAGAFILSKNGRSADFVGASGDNLADAVRASAKDGGYRYFWFSYAGSARQAADLERAWYHRFRPVDNRTAPAGSHGEWRCTTVGCATCALTAVR
jgi:hypothetical protein